MSKTSLNLPLPVPEARPLIDVELEPLLLLATVENVPAAFGVTELRERLLERALAAHAAEAGLHIARRRAASGRVVAEGVRAQDLYVAEQPLALRPGEPLRTMLIELAPGAGFEPRTLLKVEAKVRREWLVMDDQVEVDGETLSLRDYRIDSAASSNWFSALGALLFMRESPAAIGAVDTTLTVRDAEAGWTEYGPGIQRRVLSAEGELGAMLYFVQSGAQVPAHRHGHDEECLMVQGELFLDDVLLQAGDYELAPAGSDHRITQTDVGAVLYAHGDLQLQFSG